MLTPPIDGYADLLRADRALQLTASAVIAITDDRRLLLAGRVHGTRSGLSTCLQGATHANEFLRVTVDRSRVWATGRGGWILCSVPAVPGLYAYGCAAGAWGWATGRVELLASGAIERRPMISETA